MGLWMAFTCPSFKYRKKYLYVNVAVVCHKLRSVLLEIAVISCVNAEEKRKGI